MVSLNVMLLSLNERLTVTGKGKRRKGERERGKKSLSLLTCMERTQSKLGNQTIRQPTS